MKKGKALLGLLSSVVLLAGCGSNATVSGNEVVSGNETTGNTVIEEVGDQYIELALNVYYNDGETGYFGNESGQSIMVSSEGQYTVTFDCATDLSEDATSLGVNSLTNLTAIYLLDMGSTKNAQSPLKSCDIMYDSVIVNDTPLTITLDAPKSAFKSSGIFDTNDPINAWDGSSVSEVEATAEHVANFTTVDNPTKIAVTFTLSNMSWEEVVKNTEAVENYNDYTNTAVFSDMDFTNMDSVTLTKYLGNGINLGNTFEAYGHASLGCNASVNSYETYWGQPTTTEEMIIGMKNAGFDTIRIPVAWTNMMDFENGDYTINEAYLDRVEEVVNYALDAEMFVIVNDHWDGGWWGMFGSSTPATVDSAWELYESMWTQVADRFKDYNDMLIFESANEELGDRLNENTVCSDSGSLTNDECYTLLTEINQKFVDIVRASGGNNDDRFLLIAGYDTDITKTCDNRYKMPVDTVDGKLFISVHYYTPWNYCGVEKQSRWGIKKDLEEQKTLLDQMTKFTDAGYGVIIGEYAALPYWENNVPNLKDNTNEFTEYFLDNCDLYNYCPVLWSCNDLYRKTDLAMNGQDLINIYASRCYAEEEKAGDAYLASVETHRTQMEEDAADMWEGVEEYEVGTPVAWIMWNGGAGTYSVGDTFNPADNTLGIKATNAVIEGAGEYSVSLDFEGGNNGLTFAALGIASCEDLYPGAIIKIISITVDGEELKLNGQPYTSSDDGHCTRVNLYNAWLNNNIPDDARTFSGQLVGASPTIVSPTDMVDIKNITVNFEFIPSAE